MSEPTEISVSLLSELLNIREYNISDLADADEVSAMLSKAWRFDAAEWVRSNKQAYINGVNNGFLVKIKQQESPADESAGDSEQ
jgi:hypothetical protein